MSTEAATLLRPDSRPFTTGSAAYYDSGTPDQVLAEPRIHIRVELGDSDIEFLALVDSAAPWCILESRLVEAAQDQLEELPRDVAISTRLGRFEGRLYLGELKLLPDDGEELFVATTFFLSPEWPGGNFVGYVGFLDRFRFAVDPPENRFFFGAAD